MPSWGQMWRQRRMCLEKTLNPLSSQINKQIFCLRRKSILNVGGVTPLAGSASGRPAVLDSPSCPASGAAPPHHCCFGPVRSSPPSLCASCCGGYRWRWAAWRLKVGTAPPGRRRSPCRQGWAGRDALTSYTERSPDQPSSTKSADQRCLHQRGSDGGGKRKKRFYIEPFKVSVQKTYWATCKVKCM